MKPDWVKEIINGIIMDVEVKADSSDKEAVQIIRFKMSSGKHLVLASLTKLMDTEGVMTDYIAVKVEIPK